MVFSGCFTPFLVFFNEKTTVKKPVCNEITAKCSEITTSMVKKLLCIVKKPTLQGYFIAKMRNLTKVIINTKANLTFNLII